MWTHTLSLHTTVSLDRRSRKLHGWRRTWHLITGRGLHTYQRMIGCELLEDSSTTGFLQYAYDGQDFIIFNKDTLSWLAVDNVAHITKQAWEANLHELQYQKNWLEEECIAWLKRFLEYGRDTLERTEHPVVRTTQKETFPGITTLFCRAHGFYPPEISMTWMKNGEEIAQEVDYGGVLPSGDGTYQTWVSVDLDPQSNDIYSCHVEHCGRQMVLEAPQEAGNILLVSTISGTTILIIALAGVGILIWRRSQEPKEVMYQPTQVNEGSSPS
ncbi:major histocompatibility complex class I-related gene protein isoform X2 [Mus pahari]|uniref:major histocompatibility complex class I-related gene protein isoform X2 n=1 Tax=Mus pahari TaxID=10093 RepID=UPI001114FF3C|nr:major histocompatibility complex class I-related gene protein isoform X2 [Mus pahari]